jgi:hypothetical protein
MTEVLLSAETEEISDSTSFSVVALVGFLFSLVGIFSLQYIHVMPLAILASVLGVFALLISRRSQLGPMSKVFAVLATLIGTTIASWGLFNRSLESEYELSQARKISQMYLDYLSKGDEQHVMYLIGFQLEAAETPLNEQESPTKRAMKRFQNDPVHKEIRERRSPAKWVYVGFEGESPGSKGHTYKLTFRDDGQTNPPHYWIYARKNCPKYDTRETVHWFVDNLELAKKL